jgi:uncharacterized membrane protein
MGRTLFRTNRKVWMFFTCGVFVGLGFVDLLAGATFKGSASLWNNVGDLGRGDSAVALLVVAIRATLLAVPAILLGWLLQALAVVARSCVPGVAFPIFKEKE